jgi:hypothetical protein
MLKINKIDILYNKLFMDVRLDKEREELLREFVDYASNNLCTLINYLQKTSMYNTKEIIDSIKINDYETVWDFAQLKLSQKKPALYCQNYRKLLKKFPQLKFPYTIVYSFSLILFKENYDIFFDEMLDEDFDSYISGHIIDGSIDTLCYLLNQKTNYPLTKIIYAYMYKSDKIYLQKFIEWTKSSDCIREVDVRYINPFNEKHHYHFQFNFRYFIEQYYDYPEYYTNFEVYEKDICYFNDLETLEKFLVLYEYGYLIVPGEKIFNDFMVHALIKTYEDFVEIMHIYEKHGVYFDFFNQINEKKIINLLVNDVNDKRYIVRKINFFEKYHNNFFKPQILNNFYYDQALSISVINFIVQRIDKVDLTQVFAAHIDRLMQFSSQDHLLHLRKLFDNNQIIINLNHIFISYIFTGKVLICSSLRQYFIELIDEYKDKISFTNEEKILLNSRNISFTEGMNQFKKYNLI